MLEHLKMLRLFGGAKVCKKVGNNETNAETILIYFGMLSDTPEWRCINFVYGELSPVCLI
jgi:hypothetical protein